MDEDEEEDEDEELEDEENEKENNVERGSTRMQFRDRRQPYISAYGIH